MSRYLLYGALAYMFLDIEIHVQWGNIQIKWGSRGEPSEATRANLSTLAEQEQTLIQETLSYPIPSEPLVKPLPAQPPQPPQPAQPPQHTE